MRSGSEEGAGSGAGQARPQASPSAAGQRLESEFRSQESAQGLAGRGGVGLPVRRRGGMKLILGEWREGKVRPLPGNAPHDRPVSRGISCSLWSTCDDPFGATRFPLLSRTLPGPSVGVLEAWRNLSGPMGLPNQNQTLSWDRAASRRSAPSPGKRTRREDHALSHRPQMSSGRLFLDRVARQHCPSPLHRHEQINMPSPEDRGEGDISTLPAWGHFYFALTKILQPFVDWAKTLT
jgi:hypothetical protein